MASRTTFSNKCSAALEVGKTDKQTSTTKSQTTSAASVDPWAGFYKKSLENRRQQMQGIFPHKREELPAKVADNMIENCIGTFGLPLGLGLNFKVNGKELVVPMATEEPSVIAAVSGAAKIIAQHGGFTSSYSGNIMVCQVQLLDVPNIDQAVKVILEKENDIIDHGNMFVSESMKKRGGGVVKIIPRIIPYDKNQYFNIHPDDGSTSSTPNLLPSSELILNDKERAARKASEEKDFMLIVNVHVDVCEAMGANIINTVAEGLSPFLSQLVGGRAGLQIISNFAVERRAIATFRIPIEKLAYKDKSGEEVARGILEGYAMACADSYRAVTHNKGIMNGIDAAAIALGQDFRAIESGAHAWASRTGSYQPLTHYRLVKQGDKLMFEGTLELPVPIGTKGGAVQSHPTVKYTHQLLENPDCSTLGGILVSVGLAQNFAALRAMASEGIQRGHMSLHSKNIAIQAGVPQELVGDVSAFLVASGVITSQAALDYMSSLNVLRKYSKPSGLAPPPSTLYVSMKVEDTIVSILVLNETYTKTPTHLNIKPITGNPPAVQSVVLGEKHTAQWFSDFFALAQKLSVKEEFRISGEKEPQLRLQLLSLLLQILTFQLLQISPIAARDLVLSILKDATTPSGLTSQEKLKLFFSEITANKVSATPQVVKSKISSFFHPDGLMVDPFYECPEQPVEVEGRLSRVGAPEDEARVLAFKVGAPLLLSLWGSLQHYIDQDVPHRSLAHALKIAQLKAMASLAQSVGFYEVMPANLEEFMETHASRSALPFLLQAELLSVDQAHVNSKVLQHLAHLGQFLAWKGAFLEDLKTFNQENKNQLNNSYLFWLHLNGKAHEEGTLHEFRTKFEGLLQEKESELMGQSISILDTASLVSSDGVRVVQQLWQSLMGPEENVPKAKL